MRRLILFIFLFWIGYFHSMEIATDLINSNFVSFRLQLIKKLTKSKKGYRTLARLALSCKAWQQEIYNFFSLEGIKGLKEFRPYLDRRDQDRYIKNNILLLTLASSKINNYYALKIIVKRLMRSDININTIDEQFHTPLYLATRAGNHKLTKFLLNANANIYMESRELNTPLHSAALDGKHKIIEYLLHRSNNAYINKTNKCGRTALHYAAKNGHTKTVCQLLRARADKYIADINGHTPLHLATKHDHAKTAKVLLHAGASDYIIQKDSSGMSALHYAAQNGNTSLIEAFLEYKPDLNVLDNFSRTPLLLAATNTHPHVITLLLKARADVHRRETFEQLTALHVAACNGQDQIVAPLLEYGARVNARAHNHYTPLDFAVENNHTKCINLLKKNGAQRSIRSLKRYVIYKFMLYFF